MSPFLSIDFIFGFIIPFASNSCDISELSFSGVQKGEFSISLEAAWSCGNLMVFEDRWIWLYLCPPDSSECQLCGLE